MTAIFFISFIVIIVGLLVLDLGVFEKENKVVSMKRAFVSTAIWVTLSLIFCIFLRFHGEKVHGVSTMEDLNQIAQQYHGKTYPRTMSYEQAVEKYRSQMSIEYITGYLIEYSLSIDNIFVMILIFVSFTIEQKYYKEVLMWGVIGAIVMRFLFIFLASALIQKYEWILYIFGAFLIYAGIKMFVQRNKEEKVETKDNPVVKLISRFIPLDHSEENGKFFIRKNGKLFITILFMCLLVIEVTDLLFAVDSIPAIFSVTKDPFVVFFSNIFAVLGLRSLFFLVSGVMNMFRFLKIGLAVLLSFIGVKMLFAEPLERIGFENIHSLIIIISIIAVSILTSVLIPQKTTK